MMMSTSFIPIRYGPSVQHQLLNRVSQEVKMEPFSILTWLVISILSFTNSPRVQYQVFASTRRIISFGFRQTMTVLSNVWTSTTKVWTILKKTSHR